MISRRVPTIASCLLLAGLAAGVYSSTASSTVPAGRAGDGSGAITGYTVSNLLYNLDATSPQHIDSVTATLSAAPAAGSTIKLGLAGSTGATTWYTCSASGSSLTCPTTSPQATAWGVTNGGTASGCTCSTSASGTLTLVVAD